MLSDWKEDTDKEDPDVDTEPPKKLSVSRPIIGMCISVVVWVLSVFLGFMTICGPGSGEGGSPSPGFKCAVVIFFAALASGVGCFVWFIVVLVKNAYRE